ncbi:MAG: DUF3795 domain-containing protein, partial [Candidatus Ranarchaeia archaeon]
CSEGWEKYLGFRLSPSRILRCDGCIVPVEENPIRYFKGGCYIRKCAEKNRAITCAHCSGFPCEDISKHGLANTREKVAKRLGIPAEAIPHGDYERFIEPYESYDRLEAIRNNLPSKAIVEMTPPSPSNAQSFPKNLRLSKNKLHTYKSIHKVLSKIISITGETYARETVFKKRKQYLLKFLWTMGRYGALHETDPPHLAIDSEIYYQRLKGVPFYTNWDAVKRRFEMLKEVGVQSQVIPLTAESWVSPKGNLKKSSWVIRMELYPKKGNLLTLKSLKRYILKLEKRYAQKAFRYFAKGDMRILDNGS